MMARIGSGIGRQAVQVFVALVIGEPAPPGMPDHHLNALVMVGPEIFFQVKDGIIGLSENPVKSCSFMGSWRLSP